MSTWHRTLWWLLAAISTPGAAVCLATLLALPSGASAQAPPAVHEHHEDDKTGTDPTKFTRTLVLLNEFRSLGGDLGLDEFVFRYTQPLRKVKFQLTLPLDATDLTGTTQVGFGEIGFKASYLPKMTPKFGLVVFLDTSFPTATKDVFGAGKYVATPGATFAFFFRRGQVIFAPSLQQKLSYAGDSHHSDVNQTLLDTYLVWRITKTSWVTLDPQFVVDHEHDTFFNLTELEYGRLMFGGVSTYLRPGVGIGTDRPGDWNVEFGLKVVH